MVEMKTKYANLSLKLIENIAGACFRMICMQDTLWHLHEMWLFM